MHPGQTEEDLDPVATQCDYSGNIVWSNYNLGMISAPLYHRSAANPRWRKCAVPIVFILNPFEDNSHYKARSFVWHVDFQHLLTS